MPALNHIIVPAKDKHASAKFLADILGIRPKPNGDISCRCARATA